MNKLRFLLKKEFMQIFRNKFMLRIIIMLPIIQLTLLPWAASFEQKDISLSIVDNDKSTYAVQLREKAVSSEFFKLTDYSSSYNEALQAIESRQADLILEIPRNFEKNIVNGEKADLILSINALNGQKAGLAMSYLSQIINDFSRSKYPQITQPINIMPYYRYNTNMKYQNIMVPGIIVILVSLLGGMMSALNIVREKEIGTMEQINVTPISRTTFILGKLIPFWIIGLFLLTVGMIVAWIIYGLIPEGAFINIYIFAFFYLLAFTGLGLMISNFAASQQQAMFMLIFFLITFILLSGLFTPISSMPAWVQIISQLNPLRYFIEVMRLIYLKGSSFVDILPQLKAIGIFIIAFNSLAILSYRKTQL